MDARLDIVQSIDVLAFPQLGLLANKNIQVFSKDVSISESDNVCCSLNKIPVIFYVFILINKLEIHKFFFKLYARFN